MKASDLPSGPCVLPVAEAYDRWAQTYDHDDNPLTFLEMPLVRRALGDVAGQRIADIGCGTGRHTVWLAGAGAHVTGVDFSEGMLREAEAKVAASGHGQVQWLRHDLEQPLPFAAASFDRVLCGLVLEHIVGLRSLFGEMARICRPGGLVVVSVMHPAMMLQGAQAGFFDPASGDKWHPQSQRHQVSDYLMAAQGAGLVLDHVSEHAVDAALAAAVPRAEKYLGWLLCLLMRWQAPPLASPR